MDANKNEFNVANNANNAAANNNNNSNSQHQSLLSPGHVVKERWRVVKRIGGGGFGEIFECLDLQTQQHVALKVESTRQQKQVSSLRKCLCKHLVWTNKQTNYGKKPKPNMIILILRLVRHRGKSTWSVLTLSPMLSFVSFVTLIIVTNLRTPTELCLI